MVRPMAAVKNPAPKGRRIELLFTDFGAVSAGFSAATGRAATGSDTWSGTAAAAPKGAAGAGADSPGGKTFGSN